MAVERGLSERNPGASHHLDRSARADTAHARAADDSRRVARPRARGAVLARLAPAMAPGPTVQSHSARPVLLPRILGDGGALRRRARAVLGSRTRHGRDLQLVDAPHAVVGRPGGL